MKKRKKAVSLFYDEERQSAPKVTAIGKGLVAENIIKIAQEHDVPIYEDASLVELLSQLDLQMEIPENLYEVVAEVFAFIYEADKEYKEKIDK